MAVIAALTNTSLSTASGFTRTLADNLGCFGTSNVAANNVTIAFTPSAGENLSGVVLCLTSSVTYASMRDNITVTLQENVASVWTNRATVTKNRTDLVTTTFGGTRHSFVYFGGGTFPYAVTAAAGTWRFLITTAAGAGGATDWNLRTSDSTNPFFVAVGSTAVSYVNNTDQIVAVADVTIDQNFTFKGKLGTGETTRSVCGVACRGSANAESINGFTWKFNTAQYTGNLDGLLVMSYLSGFKVGKVVKFTANALTGATSATLTSAWTEATGSYQMTFVSTGQTRTVTLTNGATTCTWTGALTADEELYAGVGQPSANMGTLNIIAATSGTSTNSGFASSFFAATAANNTSGISFLVFGEYPAVEDATIATTVAIGATSMTTVETTGWVNGDVIHIGGQNNRGNGVLDSYTVTSTVGTTVNFSPAIATYSRIANGKTFKFNGYGFKMASSIGGAGSVQFTGMPNHSFWVGVEQVDTVVTYSGNNATVFTANDPEHLKFYMGHCSVRRTISTLTNVTNFYNGGSPEKRIVIDNINAYNVGIAIVVYSGNGLHLWFKNNIFFQQASTSTCLQTGGNSPVMLIEGNNTENGSSNDHYIIPLVNSVFRNNRIWANNIVNGAIRCANFINSTLDNNSYQNNAVPIVFYNLSASTLTVETNAHYGDEVANLNDISFQTGVFGQYTIISPTTNIVVSSGILNSADGSIIRIQNDNEVANDDRCYLTNGNYLRTGAGLSDTTVRTAGGFGLRLENKSATGSLKYPNTIAERPVPIGDCLGETLSVNVWVNINSATYYAGTHTMPRLYVKYDNVTTVYSEAAQVTGWQLLSIPITPATSFGQIEVWVETLTDATGSNAYVYLDDMSVLLPAGQVLTLGNMDLFANGTPVWPPLATSVSAQDVWAVDPTGFGASTVGDKVNKIKNDTGIIPALL